MHPHKGKLFAIPIHLIEMSKAGGGESPEKTVLRFHSSGRMSPIPVWFGKEISRLHSWAPCFDPLSLSTGDLHA